MTNFKLVKSAAALALGASVITSAVVVPTDASAASKYKIKSGKLVVAKTGKVAKGFVTYNKLVYKDGKKLTGLKGKTYYKAGAKATGTYKGKYYSKGVYKVATGTYNKAYYVKGVKKVTTGLYGAKYYKDGKLATGTYKATYYVNGVKKVTTGYYNKAYYVKGKKVVTTGTYAGAYYVAGKKVVTTGTYEEAYYVDGVKVVETGLYKEELYTKGALNKGLALFEEKLYNDAKLNEGLALFEEKLYDGAEFNKGIKEFEEKFYNNEVIADGTFDVAGKEEAFEKGLKVGAKVASFEAINATTIEVKFNKAVDKASAESADIKVEGVSFNAKELSEDGRTLTLTTSAPISIKESAVLVPAIETKADKEVKTPKFVTTLTYKDEVAPTVVSAAAAIAKVTETTTNKVTVKFSEPVQASAIAYVNDANVTVSQGANKDELVLTLGTAAKVGDVLNVKLTNVKDLAGNTIAPNPATISTTVVGADSVAPVLASITTKSATAGLKVTFAYDKKVTAATVDAAKTYLSANGVNVGGLTTPVVSTDGKSVSYTVNLTTDAQAAFTKDGKYSATLYVQEALVSDEAGNKSAATTQSITFDKDVVAPTLISSEVKEGKLVLNFDDAVTVVTAKQDLSIVEFNSATGYEGVAVTKDLSTAVVSNDGKTLTLDLGLVAGSTDKQYKLSFVKGALVDDSANEVAAYNKTITIAKAEAAEAKDTVAPTATLTSTAAILTGSNYVLTYIVKDEKGTAAGEAESGLDFASILNTGNYTLAGKALPAGSKISTPVVDPSTQPKTAPVVVTITIPKASITTSLTGPLTVTGLKDAKGNTSTVIAASGNLKLAEGVAPTLTTAKVSDNFVIVGFSEDMNVVDTTDFNLTINNIDVDITSASIALMPVGTDKGKYYLDLSNIVKDEAAVAGVPAKAAGFYSTAGTAFTLPTTPAVGDKYTVGTDVYTYKAAALPAPAGFYSTTGTLFTLPTTPAVGDKYTVGTDVYTYAAKVDEVVAQAAYKYIELPSTATPATPTRVKLSNDTLEASSEITSIKLTTVDEPATSVDTNDNKLTGKTVIKVK